MKRSERKVAAGAYAFFAKVTSSSTALYGALVKSLALVALALGLTATVYAQSNTDGYIFGQADGQGVTITAVNVDTGLTREAKTDSRGNYRVSSLALGKYRVTASKPGATDQVRENVSVNLGSGTAVRFGSGLKDSDVVELEAFEVNSGSVSPIDVSQTAAVTILTKETIDILPVARNLNAVALLAPGTTQGDSAFGGVSFGGSSVAENAVYINGFNVTNFRNGLGNSSVPFDFYEEFQMNTGGYGAEFGRSTGGVLSTVTKRGSNTWHAGANVYFEPDAFSDRPVDVVWKGTRLINNQQDYSESLTSNVYVSGPIIKNHLFIYGLYNQRDVQSHFVSGGAYYKDSANDPFWGGKVDWQITNDHLLEYTSFSDKGDILRNQWNYDSTLEQRTGYVGLTTFKRGGKNDIYRYTGHFFDDMLTIKALYGEGKNDRTNAGQGDASPYILDQRVVPNVTLGNATTLQPGTSMDQRKATRVDGTLNIWNNTIRFGYDNESNTAQDLLFYSGHVYYRYNNRPGSGVVNGAAMPVGTQYVRERHYENGGSFQVDSKAYYIEDTIKFIDDRLLITAGLRNESFDNKNALGLSFIKIDNQLAPRVAASFDVNGDGRSKILANFGHYYLPIAANTNIRMAGTELFTEDYYILTGLNGDSTPIKGAKLGGQVVFSDGSVKDARTIVNQDIKPMYQEEFILGYQTAIGKHWSATIRGTYRNLASTMEDVAVDAALNKYAVSKGYDTLYGFDAGGFDYYVLTNPGKPLTMYVDFGSGSLEKVSLSAADLRYPEAVRKYYSVELLLERMWDKKWYANLQYTWSQSVGNYEGWVRSDNGQTDAGITTLFDQPGLLDGAYGNLPNDKRHKIKMFGAYALSSELQIGANLLIQSGRPINAFGVHPTDVFAQAYGAEAFYQNGVLVPRGSVGTTPWTYTMDLSLTYKPKWGRDKLKFGLDIFNLTNEHNETEVDEIAELSDGSPRSQYLSPSSFQTPRYVRISAGFDF
ncbi:MAG: TonB-dependent receptor [Verrucomicrobia bacterium]|nr:TonB-dependent receptor [Verrucomicrobiota bacterium]